MVACATTAGAIRIGVGDGGKSCHLCTLGAASGSSVQDRLGHHLGRVAQTAQHAGQAVHAVLHVGQKPWVPAPPVCAAMGCISMA